MVSGGDVTGVARISSFRTRFETRFGPGRRWGDDKLKKGVKTGGEAMMTMRSLTRRAAEKLRLQRAATGEARHKMSTSGMGGPLTSM
jgi:hypothetical protein